MIDPSKLIILDRDGVINQDSDDYVKSADEWIPIEGSIESIAQLSQAGYIICVATNQSGLARQYFQEPDLEAMHSKLNDLVEQAGGQIHSIHFCPHGPDDNCHCRKPRPGMFRSIAETFRLADLSGTYTVGDSLRDLEAGAALNSTPVLVRTGKGIRTINSGKPFPENTRIYDSLKSFTESLLSS